MGARRNMKFINNSILPLALASLCLSSFVAGQQHQVVPQDSCDFWKKAQCTWAATLLVQEITDLPIPPSMEELKAVLVNGNAFFENCKECIYENQTTLICMAVDRVVAEASEALNIDIDFDVELCKKEGVVGAVKESLGMIGSLMTFTEEDIIDGTAKALADFGIDQSEARSIAVENLSLVSSAIVNPIKDGCVKLDFDFFKIVGHEGSVCGELEGPNSSVTVKGKFSVFGNTIVRYNERFDKNRNYCISAFNAGVYNIKPCVQVNTERRRVKICVEQSICGFWGCNKISELCQDVRY
jgi:hypothetical protein